MKPIWIAASAVFAFSPMALAQDEHKTHDHEPPAAETTTDAGDVKTCMAGHEGMAGCTAMDEHKVMEHGADGHQMHDASADHAMSAEDCQAKHEAMGHDPAEHCPMMTGEEEVATE